MAENNKELETTETSNESETNGGLEPNGGAGETSGDENASGNFLTDLLTEEGEGAEESKGKSEKAKSEEGDDGGAGVEVTIDSAGDETAIGDKVLQNGKPVISGTVTLEDGTVIKTDAEGKITEITEGEGGDDDDDDGLFELKSGDDIEKFDLTKKEDLEKVREYAQKGRFMEKRMQEEITPKLQEIEAREQQLGLNSNTMAYNLLYLQSQGKVNAEEFVELPYEEFVGSSEKRDKEDNVIQESTKEGDLRNWNAHKQAVANHNKVLQDYTTSFKATAADYQKMVKDFGAKHPEIKDAKKWATENLGKFSAAILTYGKEKYHPETLEMVWHWLNKDAIIAKAREEERRKKAKVVVTKDKNHKAPAGTGTSVDTFVNKVITHGDTRKIVH